MIDTMAATLETIERIENVIPRISDRRERERRGRPFPELKEKPAEDAPPLQAPAPHVPRKEPDDEDRRVDLVVRSRFLPTGQDLPADDRAPVLH
jgi:hypothetical protein